MSTDYFLFFRSDGPHEPIIESLAQVEGVEFDGDLRIRGLLDVQVMPMDAESREIMRTDFGEYGIDVDWCIRGTLDDEVDDVDDLYVRLHRCAAVFVNARPDLSMSLMWEATDFWVHNTKERLLLSILSKKAVPSVETMFEKAFVFTAMKY